ncbi:MAG: hypothetical protein OEL54_06080 [Flavobacteriaceae bacterium]|nr:hypothetical protein [Flavobacteriaceae bacterium]
MKTITAKNQNLTIEENIHNALKRAYSYARCESETNQIYVVGNGRLAEIEWKKNDFCELSINTNEGRCYVAFYN